MSAHTIAPVPTPLRAREPAREGIFREIQRHLALLSAYFSQYAKVRVSYRGDFFISLATSIAASAFSLGFVVILFEKAPQLKGWRFEEVLFLYGFSMIPYGLFNVLSLNLYDFGNNYIMEGKFDRVLLRPISSLFQVLFEVFRIESLQEIVTGSLIVWYASKHLQIHWSALDVTMMVTWALSGGVIYVSVFLFLSTFSFWFEDRIGIHPPFWNLIAFGRYPLSIYSGFIQFLLSWIIPFGFASFYPTAWMLRRAEFARYTPLAPVVAAVCLTIAILAWNFGSRRYTSTGS
jgi:ABC-2 type transport system permease protein